MFALLGCALVITAFGSGQKNGISDQLAEISPSASHRRARQPLPVLVTNTLPLKPWQKMEFKGIRNVPVPAASNGDVNGDGFSDVVVGGPLENGGRGRVVAFYGGPAGLGMQPNWGQEGQPTDERLGFSVALADVNGDGFSDLAVVDWFEDTKRAGGKVGLRIFFGSRGGLADSATQSLPARMGEFTLAAGIASAGDLNGDGFDDLAVPAFDTQGGKEFPDAVLLVMYGSAQGLRPAPECVIRAEQNPSGFCVSYGCAGDVNGDGFDDLFVGAMNYTSRHPRGGKAYVHLGSTKGVTPKPSWSMEYPSSFYRGNQDGDHQFFSLGMSSAGDVNGDGFDDVIIGSAFASHGEVQEGLAFLYLGSPDGLMRAPAWHTEANQPHAILGYSVGRAGDVNGDGFDDVVVGVPLAEHGQKDEGVAVVFYGDKRGLKRKPAWTFDGDRSQGHLGELVMGAGDLNGDGVPDLLVGGLDCEQQSDPRTRIVAVYGSKGGLRGSSEWRIEKPFLALVQAWLDHVSRETVWIGAATLAAGAILGLLFVQARLRRRLTALLIQNSELTLSEERARLARDIHDHLGADLTHLVVQLEQTRKEAEIGAVRQNLEGLTGFAGRLLDTMRELVWATSPECDTLDSLASYLSEQSATFLQTHGVRCEIDFPIELGAEPVSAALRHNLVLMLKEALHNVVQHSGATCAEVWLRVQDSTLEIGVRDNGSGFAGRGTPENGTKPGRRTVNGGLGLQNLQTRASELGGSCSVTSKPGAGTTIEFKLPMRANFQKRQRPKGREHEQAEERDGDS